MLNIDRLKGSIKTAYTAAAAVDTTKDDGLEVFASLLATAIIAEIKELKIQYSTGLVSASGAVTGTITHTVL